MTELARVIGPEMGTVNVTWKGQNGELRDLVMKDSSSADVRAWAAEAIRSGSVQNIPADPSVDLSDFMVETYNPTEETPYTRFIVRPKSPFGV